MQDAAQDYDVTAPNLMRITKHALKEIVDNSAALPGTLGPLLLFEFDLIQSIVDAAVRLAKFRTAAGTDPAGAVKLLSEFGDKFVQTFDHQLGAT